MPSVGDTQQCQLCAEEGRDGTWTWTRRLSTVGECGDGAPLPEPLYVEEWVCSLNPNEHNRRENEPM